MHFYITQYNITALALAAEKGHTGCLRVLLDAGADKDATSSVRVSLSFRA